MGFAKNYRHFCVLLLWRNAIKLLIEYVKDAAHYLTYSGNETGGIHLLSPLNTP